MKTLLILNPKSKNGKGERQFTEIFDNLKSHSIVYDAIQTEYPGHGVELANEAILKAYDRILTAGGDGTINEIVNGIMLADSRPQLGIIPNGTCNDFIKAINIPPSISKACEIIASGKTMVCDIAKLGDRYFINATGIGFDVAVVRSLQNYKILGGKGMYLASVMQNVFQYKSMDLSIEFDGKKVERNALMFTIANGKHYGGAFAIAPDADPSDGLLNAILINEIPPFRRMRAIPHFLKGTHLYLPYTEVFLTSHIKIQTEKEMFFQVEGELYTWPHNQIEIKLYPHRIDILSDAEVSS